MVRQCLAVALVAAGVSACGSITRGTSEMITFTSAPAGAAMTTSTNRSCPATPCALDIPRSEEFDATFTLPGYRPQTVPVRTKLVGSGAAGFAGNVLAGGVIGMGVDAYNGAAFDHVPNPVIVTMVPDALPSAERARGPRRGRPGV
ncbi:translation initiation factor 2 [Methylorubrum subtropicum]|uniref:translation initiation factor 2 n=1 Tax=Methylorubrum subtropicum TaxID=3138812 RepID=UPI00399D1C87